jgi:preprotein translocase subunit YajC
MDLITGIAFAAGTEGTGGQGGGFGAFIPLIIMFVIFYFLLIRPQQQKAKQHRELIASLKEGDEVISSGGLYGVVTGLTEETVTLEIAPKVRARISRAAVASVAETRAYSGTYR